MEGVEEWDRVLAAWRSLGAGDIEGAVGAVGRWSEAGEPDPGDAPDLDVRLARAHVALAEGAWAAAVSCSLDSLSNLERRGLSPEEASEFTSSFQQVIWRAGKGSAGLGGKQVAAFGSADDAKRASGAFSGLSTRLYLAKSVPVDAKSALIRHFALCAVACDNALLELCRRKPSLLGRLRRRGGADVPAIAQPLPSFDVSGPLREDRWDAALAG